ncbi:BNR-4 repeat-containing protein [Seonamhaeicola sp. ML3]|uniref:BNR-4 repeat-containing protein n=1 Tax=Seonamhaeicola sp. ML3 TaxID=2937786 RepID=UPI00200BF455|nr:BNR-4 repeat-containing protein [Seonamhaeicola sp. ML3]
MKFYYSIFLLLFIINHVSCQSEQEHVDYLANNAFGNPIVGNAGEYYKGITYITYQGEKEDPYVAAYDHKSKKWMGPYKAGTSVLGKTNSKKIDNHGRPTLVVDNEGYIHVAFGGHGGTRALGENTLGNYNGGKQIHVKSKKPMDISGWEEVDNVSPFGTYSQFLKMANGDIYLFYRHGAHRSNWVYQVSKDNGLTFSPEVSFLKAKPVLDDSKTPNAWDSWYVDLKVGTDNEILVSYNYHLCRNINNVHIGERHHCYYMVFDTVKNEWRNVKGNILKIPLTKEYADNMTLAVNTGDRWNHLGKVGLKHYGYPHISWYEGDDNGSRHGGPKQLTSYQWNGEKWIGGNTNLPEEARGEMQIDKNNIVNYLLSSNDKTMGEIAWWKSDTSLRDFKKTDLFYTKEGSKFLLSKFIRNAHKDASIIATQKIKGTNYSKVYLLGENGPVTRIKNEAEILMLD